MVFHWSLSDSKSPQVSRTRLRILAVLSKAVIWIVSVRPPISKSIIIIIIIWEFFSLALADGPPLVWEWQHVFLSLQDSSRYCTRS